MSGSRFTSLGEWHLTMNWKSVALRKLGLQLLIAGGLAGLWGATLIEGALLLADGIGLPPLGAFLGGAGFGLALGLALPAAEHLIYGYRGRAAWSALAGAVGCTLAGGLGFGFAALLPGAQRTLGVTLPDAEQATYWAAHTLVLAVLAALVAWAADVGREERTLRRRRPLAGALWGGGLGLPLSAVLALLPGMPWVALGAYVLWGAMLALGLFWLHKRKARAWLRVLTGPGQEQFHALAPCNQSIGKAESNDIPLPGFEEVFPFHCQLTWEQDHFEILDHEQGGNVLVNFRQADAQTLKSGDLIKIGSALLQYGEAS